jgi:hypothetical protein
VLLRGVLERRASSPEAYRLDASNPVVGALIKRGLLVLGKDGSVVTTRKGRELLSLLRPPLTDQGQPQKLKCVRPAKRWKKGLPE